MDAMVTAMQQMRDRMEKLEADLQRSQQATALAQQSADRALTENNNLSKVGILIDWPVLEKRPPPAHALF